MEQNNYNYIIGYELHSFDMTGFDIYWCVQSFDHMLTNTWHPKRKNQLKHTIQNNKKETLLWDAQRTVQNGFLVKMSRLKERFRTVSANLPPGNGSERFRTICFFGLFYKERFRTVSWHISWGRVFAHVLSISRLLSWKFGRKNFQTLLRR